MYLKLISETKMSTQGESLPLSLTSHLNEVPSIEKSDFEVLALPSPQEFAQRIAIDTDAASLNALPLRDISTLWGTEKTDIDLDEIPSDPDVIRSAFLQQESGKLAEEQWWVQLDTVLERGGLPESERVSAQQLIRAHSFDMQVEGHLSEEQVAVYECGNATQDALTEQELEDFKQALTMIDQLSSGALLQGQAARTIVLLEGVPLLSRGRRVPGLATNKATYIDISFLREEKFGAKFSPMLGGTLVHELLGHQLERLVTDGKVDYFNHRFHYSDETVHDERFGEVHTTVTPKDSSQGDSKPVRRYGYVSNKEDLATSVEAAGTVLMGWEQEYSKIPVKTNTPDRYRSELVIDFLRDAAHRNGRPEDEGIATPITYAEDEATGQLEVRPARVFERRELDTREVVATAEQQSLDRLKKELANKTEITYGLVSSKAW